MAKLNALPDNYHYRVERLRRIISTRSIHDTCLMTKNDLKDVQHEMKELKSDLKNEFKSEIKDLEHCLTVRLGMMLASSIGIISALITF